MTRTLRDLALEALNRSDAWDARFRSERLEVGHLVAAQFLGVAPDDPDILWTAGHSNPQVAETVDASWTCPNPFCHQFFVRIIRKDRPYQANLAELGRLYRDIQEHQGPPNKCLGKTGNESWLARNPV